MRGSATAEGAAAAGPAAAGPSAAASAVAALTSAIAALAYHILLSPRAFAVDRGGARTDAAGFPIRYSNIDDALLAELLPERVFFGTLGESCEACEHATVEGWPVAGLRTGARPPDGLVDAWLRGGAVLREAAARCPQVAMWLLLRHMVALLRGQPSQEDLLELRKAHEQYSLMKLWFTDSFVVDAATTRLWAENSRNWTLEPLEAHIFAAFRQLATQAFNAHGTDSVPAEREFSAHSPRQSLSSGEAGEAAKEAAAAPVRPEDLLRACPSLHRYEVWGSPSAVKAVAGDAPLSLASVGNALSRYWQARGLACLAGVPFASAGGRLQGDSSFVLGASFVSHLPRFVPPPAAASAAAADLSALSHACAACPTENHYKWPHLCLGAWTHILDQIRADMRQALLLSGAIPAARALLHLRDVAFSLRCSPAFAFPLPGFSLFRALPEPFRSAPDLRFLLVAGPLGPSCLKLAEALEAHLLGLFPRASVVRHFSAAANASSDEEANDRLLTVKRQGGEAAAQLDFALLATAPLLFRAPSSWSLWAALARTEGEPVYSVPNGLTSGGWTWEAAPLASNWHWVKVPMLTQEIAHQHQFDFSDPDPWIQWLRRH